MISEKLQKAREFEQEQLSKISPEERPSFHVTGGTGWINYPNGFSYYNGEYHLFYQYHPYSNEWGPMHWGHLSSKDMLAWKRLPVVMAPEESYDNFGCFSGSALELSDGRHLLMYTGVGYVGDTPMANGELPTHQTQCMAVGDGVNYEKYENNPVITGDDIPEGGSKVDFRDPKIWKEDDGYFYAVISNMTDDGNSRILLYRSPDGFKWEYVTVLDHSDAKLGKMWESTIGGVIVEGGKFDSLPFCVRLRKISSRLFVSEVSPTTPTLFSERVLTSSANFSSEIDGNCRISR